MTGMETAIAVYAAKDPTIQAAIKAVATQLLNDLRAPFFSEARLNELIGAHLEIARSKCKFVRTFLNEDESTLLSEIYVAPYFTINHTEIAEDEVFSLLTTHKRLLIEGIGGMGKTIFLKRFWSRVFDDSDSTIPIFLELRRINTQVGIDFDAFVRTTISNAKMTEKEFEKLAIEGRFTFFFDGFDEVTSEARSIVEAGIKKFDEAYKNSRIIVSTRPDLYLRGWESFKVVRPTPFNKDQAIEVVQKTRFDEVIKKNFIAQIKSHLYQTHNQFLSNPLLINIMLLTFKEHAEIPGKITVFYDRAFDVLYSKHDAKKDGWKREKKSKLSFDEFKLLFGHFCYVSYTTGSVDFRWDGFKTVTEAAAKLAGLEVDAQAFLDDLKDAVCILREEGDQCHFNHRSFQEFFSAYALNKLSSSQIYRSCLNFISRGADGVVTMFASYDRTIFERDFAIPYLESIVEATIKVSDLESAYLLFRSVTGGILLQDPKYTNYAEGIYFVSCFGDRISMHFFQKCFDNVKLALDRVIAKVIKSEARKSIFRSRRDSHLIFTSPDDPKASGFNSSGFTVKKLTARSMFTNDFIAIGAGIHVGIVNELQSMRARAKKRNESAEDLLEQLRSVSATPKGQNL